MNNIDKYDWKKIGKRIAYEREKSKYTSLESLGKQINVSRQTLSKWEKDEGGSHPSLSDMLNLCEIFHCELGYLLCEYNTHFRETFDITKATGLSSNAAEMLQHAKITDDRYSFNNMLNRFLNDFLGNGVENIYVFLLHYREYTTKLLSAKNVKRFNIDEFSVIDGIPVYELNKEIHYSQFELVNAFTDYLKRMEDNNAHQ